MKRITKGQSCCQYFQEYTYPSKCSVVDTLRLADGTLFPMPITLDVSRDKIDQLSIAVGSRLALRDPRDDEALAIITGPLIIVVCMQLLTDV